MHLMTEISFLTQMALPQASPFIALICPLGHLGAAALALPWHAGIEQEAGAERQGCWRIVRQTSLVLLKPGT